MINKNLENKAWVVLAIVMIALLLAVSFSLSLNSKSNQQLQSLREHLIKLQSSILITEIRGATLPIREDTLKKSLEKHKVRAFAVCFTRQGTREFIASTVESDLISQVHPSGSALPMPNGVGPQSNVMGADDVPLLRQNNTYLAEFDFPTHQTLLLGFPIEDPSDSFFYYIYSYQVVALLTGLLLVYLLARWFMRPYRRVIEAAQGSPVRATAAKSESEFVVETFQALVRQLQNKEGELERLHSLERRRAEKSERFSERLITTIPSALVAINSEGIITIANPQARRLFHHAEIDAASGKSEELDLQVEGMPYEEFFRLSTPLIRMISDCLTTGGVFKRVEARVTPPSGPSRQLGLSLTPILDSAQRVEGALCMMTDITEVSELRERIKLQETLANLGEMAAGLAHEFKNSLATIQGYAQLLETQTASPSPTSQHHSSLDSMLKEVRLLSRLVTDFLNFARPQKLTFSNVNLNEVLEDCQSEAYPLLRSQEIGISMQGTFPTIAADEFLLRRVFTNLILNAIEAIEPEATAKQIEIIGTVDGNSEKPYAHIFIRDTGRGILPEDLQRIFIPFFTTKSRGYGIGLAIVQKIVVAHGGDVSVEQSDESGTCFHCRLPLQASPLDMESGS